MTTREVIYAILADGYEVYVGRTEQPLSARLKQHLNDAKTGTSSKCVGLRMLIDEGCELTIKELQEVGVNDADAEYLWVTNIEGKGGVLLNGKHGDQDRVKFIPDEDYVSTPWEPEAFAKRWSRNGVGARGTELTLCVNGISFFRIGKRQLRFVHPSYGEHECRGFIWDNMIERAIAYFTEGTVENRRMKKSA